MNNIYIKEMKEEDINHVMEIENKSFSTPWSRGAFEKEITQNYLARYIVAVKDDNIVGYGGIWLIVDEGHITNIAVHPDYRCQGIGNKIVEGLINICRDRDINRMTLEVRVSNKAARSLYNKYGFKECGVRPGYYADTKEDGIIMWKEL